MNDNLNNEDNAIENNDVQPNTTEEVEVEKDVTNEVDLTSSVEVENNSVNNLETVVNADVDTNNSTYTKTSDQIADNTIYITQTPVQGNVPNYDTGIQNEMNYSQTNNGSSKNSNKGRCIALIVLAAIIIGAMTLGTKYLVDKKNDDNISITARPNDSSVKKDDKPDKDKDKTEDKTTPVKANDGTTVADIVDNAMPSIVSIACTVSQEYSFFGRNYSEDAEGSGSGIIIGQNEKQVYIATNNHVIDGANTVEITFNDGEDVKAEIKGTDSSNDLAVVAVNISDMKDSTKKAIKIASLGKSENCKVGEMAIAIGNALGYGQSVTVGVISALNREISSEDYTMSLIQTDAAINPGNSGGALLNSKGEVIGINSVKYVSEDTEGMGYAIPITEAIDILNDLMNYEEIPEAKRAYLGIVGYDIDTTFSQRSNIPEGIYIQEISKDSPATKSGLKAGDVIVEFAGKKVSTMEKLQNIMRNKKAGDKAEVKIMRAQDGQYVEKTVTVTFGARGDYMK